MKRACSANTNNYEELTCEFSRHCGTSSPTLKINYLRMKPLLLIILISLAFNFSNVEKTPVKTIDVGSATGPELKNLSEIATDIRYIPLESITPEKQRSLSTDF